MKRRPWFLLTGLLLGLGMGLLCSWVLCPVQYTQTSPGTLRGDFKEVYRSLVARAYAYDQNLPRARARLSLLAEPAPAEALAAQAQRALAAGRPLTEVRALGDLAAVLGAAPPPPPTSAAVTSAITPTPSALPPTGQPVGGATVIPVVGTPTPAASPTPFPTLPPTPTPLPTHTPQPEAVAGVPFLLRSQEVFCDPEAGPLLRIFLRDAEGNPLPGVEIAVHWLGGDERIYTGLKPDIDPGYADFLMSPDEVYQVRPGYGAALTGLRARECQTEDDTRYWGGWTLVFVQP